MPLTSTGNYMHQPPQLWRITLGKILEFTPQHTYHYTTRTNPPRELSGWWGSPGGRSFFCGTGDNLVVCWDYDCKFLILVKTRWTDAISVSVFLVHSWTCSKYGIKTLPSLSSTSTGRGGVGSIKSIAVNESHDSLAFATVSFHGKIAIWEVSADKSQHRIEDLSDGSDVEDG